MATEIEWAESAIQALEEAADYIAKDSVVYAAALVAGAEKAAESLTNFPRRGRSVPEYGDPVIREILRRQLPPDLSNLRSAHRNHRLRSWSTRSREADSGDRIGT